MSAVSYIYVKCSFIQDICGGNGTSCLGCDGKPYGLKYDECGTCGGDGSTCFDPCMNLDNCADCTELNTDCVWFVQNIRITNSFQGVPIKVDIASITTTRMETLVDPQWYLIVVCCLIFLVELSHISHSKPCRCRNIYWR